MKRERRWRGRRALALLLTMALVLSTVVSAAAVAGVEKASEPVLSIQETMHLPQSGGNYPSYPDVAQAIKSQTSLTVTAQFIQTAAGIGSLFSASNASADAQHFHVYVNGSTLGYEMRGANGANENLSGAVAVLRSSGVNTIAFVADGAAHTFKLFANGELVSTRQMDESTYHFLNTIPNLNTVQLGKTARTGNTYPFTGNISELAVYTEAFSDEEVKAYTAKTPAKEGVSNQPFVAGDDFGSQYFRIPGLYTLQNGDVMASIDVRFGSMGDSPNNLDTGVRFWRNGEDSWGPAQIPNHFVDYADMSGAVTNSASHIDPAVVQDPETGRIFMICDAFPGTGGLMYYGTHSPGSGMFEVDGQYYLGLTQSSNSASWSEFDHYMKPNEDYTPGVDTAKYTVYRKSDNTPTEYTVDGQFNLYRDGQALTMEQKNPNGMGNGTMVPMNIFYKDSLFKVYITSYLWMVSSDDNGETWSEPRIICNEYKRSTESFLGAGPGRGHVVENGPYKGRILFAVYDELDGERTSLIYSDDHGDTWKRGNRVTMASSGSPGKASEAQITELPDGTLRLFARGTAGCIGYADSLDGGVTFEPMKQDPGLAYGGNCMISAINYSQPIDGKPAILVAAPEGSGRNNGIIRIGLISENPGFSSPAYGRYSIEWKYKFSVNQGSPYAYSCLTELPNGDVALLYEDSTLVYRTFSLDTLKKGVENELVRFSAVGDAKPGQPVTVELEFSEQVFQTFSELANSYLEVSYPGTSLEASRLTYGGIREDGKTLYYTGTLAESEKAYIYRVSIPESTRIVLVSGVFVPAAGDILQGSTGDVGDITDLTVTARYSSNRLNWNQSAESGVTEYEVQRAASAAGPFETVATVAANSAVYQYIDETAGSGTQYVYRLEVRGEETTHTEPKQADDATGIDALLRTAVAKKVYTGEAKAFDGTRMETLASSSVNPDVLAAIKGMKSGTIITKVLSNAQTTVDRSILGTNLTSSDANSKCFIGFNQSGGGYRFRVHFPTNRFNAMTTDFSDGQYHTAIFTQNLDGCAAGKANLYAEIDGATQANFPNNTPMFFGDTPAIEELIVGGSKDASGAPAQRFVGEISYILITNEQLSQAERQALSRANVFPDAESEISFGENISQMFTGDWDNTWAFTGGRAAQGSYADIGGMRNYAGEFEEYVRWAKSGNEAGMQRYVINTAKAGQTVADINAAFDARIRSLDPKAVAYLIGEEDYAKGEAGLESFKTELQAFIQKALSLRDGGGFAVVQLPFAVADPSANANAEQYAEAAKQVAGTFTKAERANIVLVDHFSQTNSGDFKETKLNDAGFPNGWGHLELGRQLALATYGSTANYPTTGPAITYNLTRTDAPEVFPGTTAAAEAGKDSLTITDIPKVSGVSEWAYVLAFDAYTITGTAAAGTTITELPEGESYTLTIRSADGRVELPLLAGTIAEGAASSVAAPQLTAAQQKIADQMASGQPMNWLFVGDSITHGAHWTRGYDAVAQAFEKFLKDDLGRTDDVVINTAVSSATSASTAARVNDRLGKYDADVVSIMLGANDAAGSAYVSPTDYKAYLEQFIAMAREKGAVIVLRTPTPTTMSDRASRIPDYAAVMREIAAESPSDIILVDQFAEWTEILDAEPYLWNLGTPGYLYGADSNRLHPAENGHLLMAREFIRGCGLYRNNSAICRLSYEWPNFAAVTSETVPALGKLPNKLTLSVAELEKAYGSDFSSVTMTAADASRGRSYTETAKFGDTDVILASIPTNTVYEVTVTARLANANTTVTFPAQTVELKEDMEIDFTVLLSQSKAFDLGQGAEVGTFSVSASAPEGTYIYRLISGDGDTGNGHFTVDGDTLLIAEDLAEGQLYSIRVRADNGTYHKDQVFTVEAVGKGMIFREEDKTIASGSPVDLTGNSYAQDILGMNEGTIIVQYTSSVTGIQSLFSVANNGSGKNNTHFHIYVMDGALGLEVRNADSSTNAFNYGGASYRVSGAVNTSGKNTVALKADKEAGYYKLFANGRLVATYSGSQLTNGFKFIQDIEGANKIALGSTYRGGAPSYNFAGTIHYAEAYAAPLTDEELLAVTSETSDHPQYRVQSVSVPGAAFTMDKAYAAEGESVTVQIGEIETGKLLKNVQVADVSGNAVPVTTVEEGKTYSFTMPASAVSVSVELEDVISSEAHLLNIQYGPNVELEVTGSTEVILDANGIYGATVKGGESITLHFTPVDGTFASALLNGEAIDCTAEDCTYTFTMPDQNKVLRFTFQLVRKDLLGVVLEKAEAVTKEELDKLVPSVQKKFTTALKNARSIYADPNATQAEVDEAWKDLIDAMHYLNFEKGEKEALEALVNTAEQVKLDEFTPSSQTAFTEALEAARAICAEDEVLKEEVENAYQALHDAILALVRKADFSALQVLVNEAEGYDLDAYIQNEALKSFQKVLKEASALLDDENASQKVVDEMASELLNAMAALRRVPSKEALEELLRNLEAIGPEGYTAASYAAYRSQVNLMWAVYNDESATDEQIAKACAIGEKAPSLLKSTTTTAKKTSHTVSRSNTYGTAGTAVAVASPVIAAAQHVTAQAYVRSDTTANFTLKQGSAYCFKMTVVNGGDSVPGFTAGNGGVLKTQFVARLGNDYYYRVYAVGAPGTSTGVYTTLSGQNAIKHCVVTIG